MRSVASPARVPGRVAEHVAFTRSRSRASLVGGSVVLVVIAALVGRWLTASGYATTVVISVIAMPAVIWLGLAAVVRFEWFVWACIAVRPSLDIAGSGEIGPGAMLAGLFTAVGIVWLLVQILSGEGRPMSSASRALLGFVAAVALSVATSSVVSVSARSFVEIFSGVMMFWILEQLLWRRPDRVRRLVGAIVVGSVVPLFVGLVQWLNGDFVGTRSDVGRIRSTFVHPNPLATYLVLVILLVVGLAVVSVGRRRIAFVLYGAALAFLLVQTYNRSGWIALTIGLLYLGARFSRWIVGAMIAGAIVVAVAVPGVGDRLGDLGGSEDYAYIPDDVPDNSFEWRLQYWEQLIPLANDRLVTGIGPQVIVETRPEALEPHNVYVQTYVEMGLLGLGALLASLALIARTLMERRRRVRSHDERTLAAVAIAAGLAILVMAPSENLLNQTMAWWFFASCATWGAADRVRRSSSVRARSTTERPRSDRGAVSAAVYEAAT